MNLSGLHEARDVAFNSQLFNMLRFVQLFDPNGPTFLNFNFHRLIGVLSIVTILCITVIGTLGFAVESEDPVDNIGLLLLLFVFLHDFLSIIKISFFIWKTEKIWELFDLARMNFIENRQCLKYITILSACRNRSVTITNFLCGYATAIIVLWFVYPLGANAFMVMHDVRDQRFENVFNLRYPVTIYVYNSYYFVFYAIEVVLGMFIVYGIIIFNCILISFSCIIIGHCEIYTLAFENVWNKPIPRQGAKKYFTENYNELKSIIREQQKLFRKIQVFYSIINNIILVSVAVASGSIIILTYSFSVIYSSGKTIPIKSVIELISPLFFLSIELFFHCYLIEKIAIKKESVIFGMYSSDWSMMDLKCKKLLLLSMQMNNSMSMTIKMTPKRVIDLNLFSNVIMKSYNMSSILVKS